MMLRRLSVLLGALLLAASAHGAAVTVREPAWGLPHVFADTDLELARENGRQIARDRLGQIILLGRVGRGTLYQAFGILDASTVTGILEESSRKFAGHSSVTIDLSLVKESDSAGLALVLEWLRLTRIAGGKIYFQDVPQQIMALARISEVDDLLLENGSGVVPITPMVDAPAEKA